VMGRVTLGVFAGDRLTSAATEGEGGVFL
jgi:hypothetical protein